LRNVDGPRLAHRLAVALGFPLAAAVTAGEGRRKDENGAERRLHA
jgi:hypothetical protein